MQSSLLLWIRQIVHNHEPRFCHLVVYFITATGFGLVCIVFYVYAQSYFIIIPSIFLKRK